MSKTCENGVTNCLRPIGSGAGDDADYARSISMCNPHATEAGMENSHSDNSHDAILAKIADKKRLTPSQKAETEIMATCWICHPELNLANEVYAPRQGTSRAGMVINISIRAAAGEKARQTADQIGESFSTSIKTLKTGASLRAVSGSQDFLLFWDIAGRFAGGTVTEDGKTRKVRNVAEVLRIAS